MSLRLKRFSSDQIIFACWKRGIQVFYRVVKLTAHYIYQNTLQFVNQTFCLWLIYWLLFNVTEVVMCILSSYSIMVISHKYPPSPQKKPKKQHANMSRIVKRARKSHKWPKMHDKCHKGQKDMEKKWWNRHRNKLHK